MSQMDADNIRGEQSKANNTTGFQQTVLSQVSMTLPKLRKRRDQTQLLGPWDS